MRLPPYEPAPWIPFRRAWRELKDHLLERREIRLLLTIMSLVAIFAMPYYVLLPILARNTLGVGPRGFGLLMAASGVGALLGGLTLAWRVRRRPPMPSFLGGLGAMLVGLVGLGFCRNYHLALGFIFLAGFGMVTQLSTGNSLLQLNVPNELRGRIMSLFGLIVMGLVPIGSLLFGVVAHYLGPGPTIALGSVVAALSVGAVLFRHPEFRHFTFGELEAPAAPSYPNSTP
jgi:MFS family permease